MPSFRVVAQIIAQAWKLLTATQPNPKVFGMFHLKVLHFSPKHYQGLMQRLLLQAKCGVEVCIC